MFQMIKPNTNFDFVGNSKYAYILSFLLLALSIGVILFNGGPNYGVDFKGGTLIQVKFDKAVDISDIKDGLSQLNLENVTVQNFSDGEDTAEYLIQTDTSEMTDSNFNEELEGALNDATGATSEIRRTEMVGPAIGKELQDQALQAIFFALLFIAIYISGRFENRWLQSGIVGAALIATVLVLNFFKINMFVTILIAFAITILLFWKLNLRYAMGATLALTHDVIVTVGILTLLGREMTLPIVAAILTIIGYSLNDTIIVFDRIRENIRKHPREKFSVVINESINETLSRTILTSGTTLIVVVVLLIFGGSIIRDFTLALFLGIVVGTYSSIYVASPILLLWKKLSAK